MVSTKNWVLTWGIVSSYQKNSPKVANKLLYVMGCGEEKKVCNCKKITFLLSMPSLF